MSDKALEMLGATSIEELSTDKLSLALHTAKQHGGIELWCIGCGQRDQSKFKTITFGHPLDPPDYDIECLICGSTEVEEGAGSCVNRLVDQRDALQQRYDRLKAVVLAADALHVWTSDSGPMAKECRDKFIIARAEVEEPL